MNNRIPLTIVVPIILFSLSLMFISDKAPIIGFLIFSLFLLVLNFPEMGIIIIITDGMLLLTYYRLFDIQSVALLLFIFIIGLFAIIVNYFNSSVIKKGIDGYNTIIFFFVIFFGVLLFLQSYRSPSIEYGKEKATLYVIYNFFYFLLPIIIIKNAKKLKTLYNSGIIVGVLLIVFSFLILETYGSSARFDATGTGNSIWYSRNVGLSIIFLFWGLNRFDNYLLRYFIFLPAILAGLYFMGLAGSRGPIISLFVTFALYYLIVSKIKLIFKIIIILSFLSIAIMGLIYFIPNIAARVTSISEDLSTLLRLYSIYLSIQLFFQSPLLGWGSGSFESLVSSYIKYPHNIFVETALELGIIGLLLFVAFSMFLFIYLIRELRKKRKKRYFELIAIIFLITSYGFINAQFSGDIAHNPIMWFGAGLVCSIRQIDFTKENNDDIDGM